MKYTTNKILEQLFNDSGMTKTAFCETIDLTTMHLRNVILNNQELKFSTIDRAVLALGLEIEITIKNKTECSK